MFKNFKVPWNWSKLRKCNRAWDRVRKHVRSAVACGQDKESGFPLGKGQALGGFRTQGLDALISVLRGLFLPLRDNSF